MPNVTFGKGDASLCSPESNQDQASNACFPVSTPVTWLSGCLVAAYGGKKMKSLVSPISVQGKKQYTDQIRWPRARLPCLDLVPVLVVTRGVERDTAVRVINGRTGVGCLRDRLLSASQIFILSTLMD